MSNRITKGGEADRIGRLLSVFSDGTGYINLNPPVGEIGAATFDVSGGAAEDLWTDSSHGMRTGDLMKFTAVGTGAEPFLVDTFYWVITLTANTYQLASSLANAKAGTQIEGTNANSSGTWTAHLQTMTYRAGPAAGEKWDVTRILIHVRDTTTGFADEKYGGIDLSGGTGLQYQVGDADGNVLHILTGEDADGVAQMNVKSMFDYGILMGPDWVTYVGKGGATDSAANGRWTFMKAGRPVRLDGDSGHEIQVVIADDLSGLVNHVMKVQGEVV